MTEIRRFIDGKLVEHWMDGNALLFPEQKPISIVRSSSSWPMILLPIKAMAKNGDRGAGDIIARVIGPIGGDAFKIWYKKIFGQDCGCGHRQEVLNQRWPLP